MPAQPRRLSVSWLARTIGPWLCLGAFLAWGWRTQDFIHSVPGYGDILEMTWGISWYQTALSQHVNPAIYPLAFYPGGWHLAANGVAPELYLALVPLSRLGGAAFAYNIAILLTFVVAFAGAYALARRFVDCLPSTVAALLITFWGLRWFQTIGHLNFLLCSAMLPWMLWALEHALAPYMAGAAPSTAGPRAGTHGSENSQGHARLLPMPYSLFPIPCLWLILVGVFWAISSLGTLYAILIGGIALVAWLGGRLLARQIRWSLALVALAVPGPTALILISPVLLPLLRESQALGAAFYSVEEVNFWGTSLNALPVPYIFHPWLWPVSRWLYRGLTYEQGAANLGTLATLAALAGCWHAWRDRNWRPMLVLTVTGLVLSLGLTLKWNNESIQWAPLRPLDDALWQIAHILKPGFFQATRSQDFVAPVPLPGLVLTAIVPFFERARVFARYALIGGIGAFLLAALALARLRRPWVRWLLAAALALEVIPPPLPAFPYPPVPQPAFAWLSQQRLNDQSIIDLIAAHPYTPVLYSGGESLFATIYHHQPTVAGASSVWPAYAAFLSNWLATHEHAFWNPDLVPILRFYRVHYILIHMQGTWEQGLLAEARQNAELKFVQCFSPPGGISPWNYPICILEVEPPATPDINVLLGSGWSGKENWGVWAEGTESQISWVAMAREDADLSLTAFPNCIPGQDQGLSIEVDGKVLASHTWQDCDPWSAVVAIPAALVQIGANEVVMRTSYAAHPVGGSTSDPRLLSAGFTKLKIN